MFKSAFFRSELFLSIGQLQSYGLEMLVHDHLKKCNSLVIGKENPL